MNPNHRAGPVLYCGDPHSKFAHICEAAISARASAVVLLGDLELRRPLHEELATLQVHGIDVCFIHGNHDADSDASAEYLWGSRWADRNVHGRVTQLPDGTRVAGLGGVFRASVWYPSPSGPKAGMPVYRTRADHARATPRQDRWRDGPPRRHLGSIYPEDLDRLADLRADVLITHEAPGYHPHGMELLDALAQVIGVKLVVHGHHHDRLDSGAAWERQGFKSFGVGLRGVTAINLDGQAQVLVPGELDEARSSAKEVR